MTCELCATSWTGDITTCPVCSESQTIRTLREELRQADEDFINDPTSVDTRFDLGRYDVHELLSHIDNLKSVIRMLTAKTSISEELKARELGIEGNGVL
jgi:hypothetical protein